MKCPHCQKEISIKLENCPYCDGEIYRITVNEVHIKAPSQKTIFIKWKRIQVDRAIMAAFLAIALPFSIYFLQNNNIMFTDLIASTTTIIIYTACNLLLIPWTFSKMLIGITTEIINYTRERLRPSIKEVAVMVGIFAFLLLYLDYIGSQSTLIITVIAYAVRLFLSLVK